MFVFIVMFAEIKCIQSGDDKVRAITLKIKNTVLVSFEVKSCINEYIGQIF
ncbi:hypothetical protein VISI1226_23047 [Vibrio sinaloensis DSM 21326]|uniref:Uncharacterized protein n=1 Tax=Vibrio sinaloensis DSM 21326 TaxID=945550 RepID=E8MC49_PHOS4|nr:hypothetical protein VISI1226_23047 [Vibrio sinaloensis DSM 21326]